MHAVFWFPVEFNEAALTFRVDESESVYPKTFHYIKAFWQGTVAHQPHYHVRTFCIHRYIIPESIMCRCGLRHFVMRFGFYCMNKVREFNRILHKEDGHVITY